MQYLNSFRIVKEEHVMTNKELQSIYRGAYFFRETEDGWLQAFQYSQQQMDYFESCIAKGLDFWYDRGMASSAKTLELTTEAGTTPETNLLVGADELINQYEINSSTVVTLLDILSGISQSLADQYNYLARKNAGTGNNKYFFGLTEDDLNLCTYKNENNENDCVVRSLSMGDEKLGFYNNWEAKANQAFLINEINPVKLFLKGDVNRSGDVTVADVNALVEIVLGKVTEAENKKNYDFEAAHVNADEEITIADVTALVNIILKKTQN